ncbi:hypothetical protein [Chryseobacterium tongliaoense]|uniref:hypothetical protein n=1 Tax=Chryseobacterium tongliaoense TaxID=3240933 RepID=UPI003514C338
MRREFILSNRYYTRVFLAVMLPLLILDILLMIGCFLLSFKGSNLILIVTFIVLFVLLIVLFGMRCLEFESTGMVISVRSYHPFTIGWTRPVIEFPAYLLNDFSVRNHYLYLKLKKDDNRFVETKVRLDGLTRNQIEKLQKVLRETIEYC